MSYNEIEYTLRTLGVSNSQSKDQIAPQEQNSTQEKGGKSIKGFTENQIQESVKQTTLEQKRLAAGRKSVDHPRKERPISVSCNRSDQSFSNSNKKKLIYRTEDSNSVSHNPRQILCSNCQVIGHSEYFQITSRSKDRIDLLQLKIKLLQKQIQNKNYNPTSYKNSPPQYFSCESERPQQLFQQQRKFIHKCVQMIAQLTRSQNPSLKYCWKFIKQSAVQHRTQYLSPRHQYISPTKETLKSGFLISNLKSMLHVKHRSQISKKIASLIISHEIHQRIYQKAKKILKITAESPSMLLYYLDGKERRTSEC